MRPDERRLLVEFASRGWVIGRENAGRITLRDLGAELGLPPKRVYYLALKWAGRDWYDYGTLATVGWLTEAGVTKAREVGAR